MRGNPGGGLSTLMYESGKTVFAMLHPLARLFCLATAWRALGTAADAAPTTSLASHARVMCRMRIICSSHSFISQPHVSRVEVRLQLPRRELRRILGTVCAPQLQIAVHEWLAQPVAQRG